MTKRDAPRGGYRGGLPAAQVGPPAPLSSATIHPTEGLTDADLRADLVERLLGEIESWRRCRDALLGSLEEAEARADSSEREVARLRQGLADLASDSPHVAAKYWRQRRDAINERDALRRTLDQLRGSYRAQSIEHDRLMGREHAMRERAEAAEAKIARVRLALNAGAAVGQATPIPDVWRAVMRALADPAQDETGGEA